ncbi:MAG TPA: hypothetical protein VNM34_06240 [Verrucomicrobiae bacterium]|nr:hypothetical protein [Verrucomicrobiae bacterium]
MREAFRGPWAAVGAILGGAIVVIAGLTLFAPTNCGPTGIAAATDGLTFLCGNVVAPPIETAVGTIAGFKALHTISWLIIGLIAAGGAVIGASLSHETESAT